MLISKLKVANTNPLEYIITQKVLVKLNLSGRNIETKTAKTICIEFQISNKKWFILFAYRPPKFNKNDFFSEISYSLNKYPINTRTYFLLEILTL